MNAAPARVGVEFMFATQEIRDSLILSLVTGGSVEQSKGGALRWDAIYRGVKAA